ncbi:MAG TPA: sugar phosphate isomerase/epimerase [Gemmatimonas sp.]|nr:sugar phosphate isomerase/epimerase [Gemmatimonas sp.]
MSERTPLVSRRDTLRLLAAAAAGGTLLPRLASGAPVSTPARALASVLAPARRIARVGLHLGSVRAALRADIAGTLAAIADAGVHEVEFTEYLGKAAPWWRAILREHGLTAPSAHAALPASDAGWTPLFAHARAMQHNWLVVASVASNTTFNTTSRARRNADWWKRFAARLDRAAKLGAGSGVNVAYHARELDFARVAGTSGFEILMAETDPSLVDVELDIYSALAAGQDPLAMLEQWRGRFTGCHVRDMGPAPARRAVNVGEGTIDFAAIVEKGSASGLRHWFISTADPRNPMESVRVSALALSSL